MCCVSIGWIGKRQRGGQEEERWQGGGNLQLSWKLVGRHRDRRWISACRSAAGWDVLLKECSALLLFTLLQWQMDSSVSWHGAPVLTNALLISSCGGRALMLVQGMVLSLKKKWCPHICRGAYVKHSKEADGWGCWYSFICVAYFT